MPVTSDFQFELGTSPALLMGPGTAYEIVEVEGLDLPAIRVTDVPKAAGNGSFRGNDYKAERTVTITLEIHGTAGSDLATKITDFATAWNSRQTNVDLTYRLPGVTNRKVVGTPRRCAWKVDQRFSFGVVDAACEFVCVDPRIFETAGGTEVLF